MLAFKRVLQKAKLKSSDIEHFEINEAFSVVPMVAISELSLLAERLIHMEELYPLGHPIGASGARILTTLINALSLNKQKFGLASICIGGGEASSIIIENMNY